jgi:hypothetical protein|tara:strand:+ start:1934 stop:2197 length:264 start_codon:yes stop_codon:yes gene_type:complete
MSLGVCYLKGLMIRDTGSPDKKHVSYDDGRMKYSGYFHISDLEGGTLKVNLLTNAKGLVQIKPSGRGFFEGRLENGILVDERDVVRS